MLSHKACNVAILWLLSELPKSQTLIGGLQGTYLDGVGACGPELQESKL